MKVSIFVSLVVFASHVFAADVSELCSPNAENLISFDNQITSRPSVSDEITVLSWNAHKYANSRYFTDLKKLAEAADLIMLQEVLHTTGWQSRFLESIPFAFTFFKSFCTNRDEATGVQTGARFNLQNNFNLVSPGREPVTNTPKVSGISRVEISGHGSVLMVNTHALNFNTGNSFERQMDQIATYIAAESGPVIWAGDFNTWNNSRQKYIDRKTRELGFVNVNPVNDDRTQKLDHIYVRGFTVVNAEVLKQTSSDHRPIIAVLKFKN